MAAIMHVYGGHLEFPVCLNVDTVIVCSFMETLKKGCFVVSTLCFNTAERHEYVVNHKLPLFCSRSSALSF